MQVVYSAHFGNRFKKIELTLFKWDRAIHEGNFPLYVDTFSAVEWLFRALGHYNYARAVAVHLRDILTLPDRHQVKYDELCKGNFTVKTSNPPFSNMSLDGGHGQNSAFVNEEGGAVGLTEKSVALMRWMVAESEMARVVTEFLYGLDKINKDTETNHYEDQSAMNYKY